ncbi:predicted protein [Plenodomus lingam JN3]|uniref:Uncharacterized protein n=1 Tax=Leptosphaeria maculans (strain JN3 / isolate v23.1.3 / race Av1-4-5-6-7-8) TaxID=985895 RepID=M1ZME6_LEPMJ|nr:predicted protein [Plenodomus lingam JN3]
MFAWLPTLPLQSNYPCILITELTFQDWAVICCPALEMRHAVRPPEVEAHCLGGLVWAGSADLKGIGRRIEKGENVSRAQLPPFSYLTVSALKRGSVNFSFFLPKLENYAISNRTKKYSQSETYQAHGLIWQQLRNSWLSHCRRAHAHTQRYRGVDSFILSVMGVYAAPDSPDLRFMDSMTKKPSSVPKDQLHVPSIPSSVYMTQEATRRFYSKATQYSPTSPQAAPREGFRFPPSIRSTKFLESYCQRMAIDHPAQAFRTLSRNVTRAEGHMENEM